MFRRIGILVLVVGALLALTLALLATPPGRTILARVIEHYASTSGLTVSIHRLTGWPPFWFGADGITIADIEGPAVEIENLAIDTNLTDLLSGAIVLDDITAARVAIEREPRLSDETSGEGGVLPFLVQNFAVARLELSDAIAGRRTALAVEGRASGDATGALALNLNAERIDGIHGTLVANLERAASGGWPSGTITASETANGILVGLMGRKSGPGYAFTANAVPNDNGMRGSVTLSSDNAARFTGRFALAADGEATRVTLKGSGELAELVPPTYADLLSGPIDLSFDGSWVPGENGALPRLSIRQGVVRSATIDGSVSGELDRNIANLSLRLELADPTGAAINLPLPNAPARIQRASLRGTVEPADGLIRLDLMGNVAGLTVGEVSVPATGLSLAVEAPSDDPLAGGRLPFALRLETDSIRMPAGELRATPAAPILLTAEGTADTEGLSAETAAAIRVAGGHAEFRGTVSPGVVTGSLSTRLPDIRPIASLLDQNVSGGVTGSATGTFFGGDGTDLEVAGDLADLDLGNETLRRLLRGQTRVRGNFADSDGVRSVSDFSIEGHGIRGTGNASIGAGRVDASLEGTISDLSILADRSSGSAAFTTEISGALPYPTVDATLRVGEGALLQQPIRNGVARVRGEPSDNGWSGTLELDGELAGKALAGSADFVVPNDSSGLALPAIDLTVADNRITGALERTGESALSGEIDIDARNLRSLAALALVDVAGSARAHLRFEPDGERQTIAVSFNGNNIVHQPIAARTVEGEARIEDAFGAPRIAGHATAQAVATGAVQLDRMAMNASIDGGETGFDVQARGPDIDLAANGVLAQDAGVNVVRLDNVSGTAFRIPITLAAPASVRLDGGGAETRGATLAIGRGRVVVDATAGAELDVTATASDVPASLVNAFAPNLGAQGVVNGRATVSGQPSAPEIAWQLDWSELEVAATRSAGLPPLRLSARGDATKSATGINGTLSGAGMTLDIAGTVPFAGNGLNVAVRGAAPLSLLATQTTRELRLSGTANIDVAATGALRSPRLAGNVDLADATVVDTETGFGVSGARGRIALEGQRATIERIDGRLAQGGQIAVNGSVDIGGAQMPANLTVRVANGRYNDGEVVDTTFNANLAMNGPLLGGGTLSGNVALGRTQIQLPDRLGGGASAIDVSHVNPEPGFKPPQLREAARKSRQSAGGNLRVSIDLTNTGGIFVRGFGIDSEFGGSLRITNTIADPQAAGAFEMRRGRIEFLGRRYDLVKGLLTFAGTLVPTVDFTAVTTTSDATIDVNVTGPADNPDISFTSNPDFPEEEILSRLLFDREVSRLSPVQAAQLVDAAAQLSGVAGGRGIFGSVRQALGVDDLDIRQTASGGTTVGIGRRINERVRLGVEAGAEGRVTIDLDITPNLKVRGAAGASGAGQFGLSYEREY